ncbi:MAG: type II 3-dehydroquinate dehydratase [Flavobacteriales bacterium]
MKFLILNGPNLNLIGKREPELYGVTDFLVYLESLRRFYSQHEIAYFQSNAEGDLIDQLHEKALDCDGILLNAGAYTHTSIALADAIKAVDTPVIEVHISNVGAREFFRRRSYMAAACRGTISGFGLLSYELALLSFLTPGK